MGTRLTQKLTHDGREVVQLQLPPMDSNHHSRIQSRSEHQGHSSTKLTELPRRIGRAMC